MFTEIFANKELKPKEKTELLSNRLAGNPSELNRLIEFADKSKDPVKGTCIEAMEFATRQNPECGTKACFDFAVENLASKAPRVKWESAKVIGNIAARFPKNLEPAISGLLINSEHEGTVVRWSAAFALGEIIKLKLPVNAELVPAAEAIMAREEKNSIRKIYDAALKKIKK